MPILRDRVLITGANGLFGQELRSLLDKNDFDIIATGLGKDRLVNHSHKYFELDISSSNECNDLLEKFQPSVIVNAAACTNVDQCEFNRDHCLDVNAYSLNNFLRYCQKKNAHLIQISTDFVFDGESGNYIETDLCNPVNFYGFSKLKAETTLINSDLNYTIIRTSLIYGPSGSNFFTLTKEKMQNKIPLKIVDDQFRTPTYLYDLTLSTMKIIIAKKYGIYHISSGESLSILNIVCNIAKYMKYDTSNIKRINSSELSQIAKRPFDSTLDVNKSIKNLDFIPTKLNEALNKML